MVRNCTNMAPRAGAGIFASLALAAATAVAPSAFGQLQCGTIPSGSDGQIGIQGGFTQECNFDDCWDLNGNGACDLADEDTDMDGDCDVADCGWTGLAFPIDVVGAPPCPADVVVNGAVDVKDLLFMLGAWGPCPPKGDCPADFDLSGAVDVKDLLFLLGAWGPCPLGAGPFVDTLTFSLNTNRAGGDVYIVGPTDFKGVCQPDITNILATMCCSLEGKATGEPLVLHFPPVATDGGLWVVFVGRTGSAGILPDGTCEGVTCDGGFNDGQPCLVDGDCLGGFDGSNFPSHQVARLCDAIPDGTCDAGICNGGFNDGLPCETDGGCLGGCTAESALGRAYANISPGGTGNPGDWTDLHNLGSPPLGTFYDVALSMTGADPDAFDCSQFAGGCCLFDGTCTEDSHPFDCIEAGSTYAGDGVDCAGANCQPICSEAGPKGPCGQPDAGPCAFGNGSPGCDDPICCCTVCETMPECCLFEWTTACAVQATTVLNCAPEPGQPSDLATGPDETVDGYLRIGTDDFGSWADLGFGTNALGEDFNPVGDEPADGPTFGQYFSVYRQAAGEFESLTTNSEMDDICTNNNSMTRGITTLSVNTDTNADGVDDTKVSTWELISMSGMDTSWVLTQHVFNATPKGGPLVAIVTFEFEITNNTGDPVDFILHRHLDIDSTFGPGGFGNDNVGTRTNGAPGVDRFVYQGEVGHPEWSITLSSPTGGVYYGVKQLVNPQGNGCVDGFCVGGDLDGEPCKDDLFCLGGCEFTLAGTTSQICLNLGTPECWKNHIASVGYDTDGDSGANPGTDAAFGMEIPVSIPANDVVIVNVMLTYGAETPGGE